MEAGFLPFLGAQSQFVQILMITPSQRFQGEDADIFIPKIPTEGPILCPLICC